MDRPGYLFPEEEYSFGDVVESVKAYFKEELTKDRLGQRMSSLMSLEQNPLLRIAPLEIKIWGCSWAYSLPKMT